MRAKTIAIENRKGGTGKTSTAMCLAEILHARGSSTLLVDMDQQHNATKQYRGKIDGITTVYDLLTDPEADLLDAIQRFDRGDLVAGDDLMNNVEIDMGALLSRETMLCDALDKVREDYDYIIIDCSPSLGIATVNVLVASDTVVVPVECDRYSIEGYDGLMHLINQIRRSRRLNPNLTISGLLVTKYEARPKISQQMIDSLQNSAGEHGTIVFGQFIRKCCKVREAQQAGIPLIEYAPECTSARDYRMWTNELLERIE